MIHLDTNYLIGLATRDSPLRSRLEIWLRSGEALATSAIAWGEFLTGPVTIQQIRAVSTIINDRVIPFGEMEAALSARLYNQAGRKRAIRVDSFIAATAIASSAPLATENQKDFRLFLSAGLRLA